MNIGFREILIILVIVLLLFGAKRIPELMRSLGQGMKEFKKAAKDLNTDDESSSKPSVPAPKTDSDKKA